MKKIATYKNGNTLTTIYDDGTKLHYTQDNEFKYEFPESHDISISQCCDNGCSWCYYGCSPTGKHGKLLGWNFFDTMRPYTEVAVNLQLPLNPQFEDFLKEMNNRKVIVNVTVNQNHFMKDELKAKLHEWVDADLVKGIGISLVKPSPEFIDAVWEFKNSVVHVIAGVTPIEDIMMLMGHNLKILILGYKSVGRGGDFYYYNAPSIVQKISDLKNNIDEVFRRFQVVSFDNLAIKQLNIKSLLSGSEWEEFYGGDDGTLTFFIDLVKGVFARNSLSHITYTIGDKTVDEMFSVIRKEVSDERNGN